ncbi:MAG TPA: hypothetical protein VHO69_09390, partial [Phototrophicaceae bacterium]|nr:hypothetical protein [Phototrophicaceae bacterium]
RFEPGATMQRLFRPRADLTDSNLPQWEYAILALTAAGVLHATWDNGRGRVTVDLRGAAGGIYSGRGKKLLRRVYGSRAQAPELAAEAARWQAFLSGKTPERERVWNGGVPLRWASGGVLPIVEQRGQTWALLFFRDIPPVGWNVANGASADAADWLNPARIIEREFAEETILLNQRPEPGQTVEQLLFADQRHILTADALRDHTALRREHDNLTLNESQQTRTIDWLATPLTVRVLDRAANDHTLTQECPNVLVTVNPAEMGLEVIRLGRFRLNNGEYLLDGEFHPWLQILTRRPVLLLSINWLHNQFQQHGTLGEQMPNDSKQLPPVPGEHYRLFDADIEARKTRLAIISQHLNKPLPEAERQRWSTEKRWCEGWLEQYAAAFQTPILLDPALRTLCPVTWKTLELAFAHQLLNQ